MQIKMLWQKLTEIVVRPAGREAGRREFGNRQLKKDHVCEALAPKGQSY